MRLAGPARATTGVAILTAACWLLALFIGGPQSIAVAAGYIPVRPVSDVMIVPALLTPLSATLVHGGLLHLGFNLLMLIVCGRDVEAVIGTKPLIMLYVAGAYVAAGAQYLADPTSPVPMIGASGATSAVLAVYALLFSRNEVRRLGPFPAHWVRALWLAVAWIGVQWLTSFATRGSPYAIATAAHVGGFLAGLALARPLLAWRYRSA